MSTQVGVDIGGTFTDVVVESRARRWSVKVPTTHASPEEGVLEAVARGLEAAGADLRDVSRLVHGTTLATNAVIERKGAKTALLTTEGFRDVLEMGHEGRFDQYDLRVQRPAPLVPRRLRFTIPERVRADGSIVKPLDREAVVQTAQTLRRMGIEACAVMFLHAYANGAHERQVRDLLQAELGELPISLSHEVSPEIREYERVSTTCANAYLQPLIGSYLLRLQRALQARGLRAPMLMILSSGGLTTVETAARFPIRLLESGPAGGAIFAADVALRLGLDKVLSLDVGGTTAKFCLIDGGHARHARQFEIGRTYRFKKGSGLPVRVPVIDLVEIGAGGGSVARLDAVGRIAVGPESAGSEPGPACYGRGGGAATVTDCDLIQGKLDGENFAGGTMRLDAEAAERAIAAAVGGPAGLSNPSAAFAVTETMAETMAAAAREHAAELGVDLTARTLIAFGGGAPLQAARFAQKLGIERIIVPAGAGVGSAIGFLRAPLAFEVVRTARLVLPGGDLAAIHDVLQEMHAQAVQVVSALARPEELSVGLSAHVRYLGQGHELEVRLAPDLIAPAGAAHDLGASVQAAFATAYRSLYGRSIESNPVEVIAWMVRVHAKAEQTELADATAQSSWARPQRTRSVYDGLSGTWSAWPEYARDGLAQGAAGRGPAILAERETTTIAPDGFSFAIVAVGAIQLTRESA